MLRRSRGHVTPTPHSRSVLKLLYISFLFCTLGVRVLKSCRYVRPGAVLDQHQLHYIVPSSPLLRDLPSCGFPVAVCGPVSLTCACSAPGLNSMAAMTPEPSACALTPHLAVMPPGPKAAPGLSTAVRKENCLPLKMLLVKMRRRAPSRPRRSLRPPGPPAVVPSRGKGGSLGPAVSGALGAGARGREASPDLERSAMRSAQQGLLGPLGSG